MTEALCFKAILSFVSDLNCAFGKNQRPIALYFNILEKVTFTKTEAIEKNIQLFQNFCNGNQTAILERSRDKLTETRIQYSNKAYIDLEYIFSVATEEQIGYIWEHLLTIMAIIDPASNARHILHSLRSASTGDSGMGILDNIIKKIGDQITISESSNPVEMVSKIIESGMFGEIVADLSSGIQNGQIDVGKLASSIDMDLPALSFQDKPLEKIQEKINDTTS